MENRRDDVVPVGCKDRMDSSIASDPGMNSVHSTSPTTRPASQRRSAASSWNIDAVLVCRDRLEGNAPSDAIERSRPHRAGRLVAAGRDDLTTLRREDFPPVRAVSRENDHVRRALHHVLVLSASA